VWGEGTKLIAESVAYNVRKREEVIDKIKKSYPNTKFNYEYKGKYPEVMPHQKVMYNMICCADVCSIISDPGTCKTGPYLWAIDKRIQRGEVKKALVITLSQLKENVLEEMSVQVPHLKAVVLQNVEQASKVLNKSYKKKHLNLDYDVYIANYESMFRVVDMIHDGYFDMVVLDEAHKVGSHSSRQTQSILDAFEAVKYKAILTGTLHANDEMSFFMPFRFLGPDTVCPASFNGFRQKWMYPVDPKRYVWKPSGGMRYEVARTVGKLSVMFKKEDCINLPGLITETIHGRMEGDQKEFYDEFKKNLVAKIDDMCNKCSKQICCDGLCDDEIEAKNILVLSSKLLQVTSGFFTNTRYEVDEKGVEKNVSPIIFFKSNPKLELLKSTIENIPKDRKIIIWSVHVPAIHIIEKELISIYGKDAVMTCYGDQNAFEQVRVFRENANKRFMIANQKKMGVGLNIQFSSYSIFYAINYSYVTYEQALGRQDRMGQKDVVTAFNLCLKGSVDEAVYKAMDTKEDLGVSLSRFAKII
jgi:SNF2 family DNA or RNA helicase